MNDSITITCPNCQAQFPLSQAIADPIVAQLRSEIEADVNKRTQAVRIKEQELVRIAQQVEQSKAEVDQKIAAQLEVERKKIAAEQEKKAKEAVTIQLCDLQQQITEKNRKLAESQQKELALLNEKRELENQRAAFELEKAKQIEQEREKIRAQARQAVLESSAKEMAELNEKLALKDQKLAEAQTAELALRKEKLEFEEQKRAFELELARRAEQVTDAVRKEKDEEFRLKEAENAKKMDDLKRQIDELRRKAEQGSQQAQGEVLELDLEAALQRCFGEDDITPVPKGVNGGDLLQRVYDELGHDCGTIIWEFKRTKSWSDGWLAKLKDDRQAAKAHLAILVSTTMPKDVATFECREGVWIAPPALAVSLAAALRISLIHTAEARRAAEGRQDKVAAMYDYLSGPEFKSRLVTIMDAFTAMRVDLEKEKSSMQKIWAKREKQIERVLINTAGLHGDLAGIIGKSLPAIEALELSAIADQSSDTPLIAAAGEP